MGRHAPLQRRCIARARRRRGRLRGAPARAGGRHAAADSFQPRHPQLRLADIRTHLRRYRGPARAGAGGGGGRGARRAGRADSGAGARMGGAARAGHAAGAALGPREWRDVADGPRGRAVRAAARARHRLRAHAGNPASRLRLDYGLHRRSVAAGAGAAAHAVCGGGGGALSRLAGGAHAAGRCLAHGVTLRRGLFFTAILAIAIAAAAWWWTRETPAPPSDQAVNLLSSADITGYARAFAPRSFIFPADHGPHPAFRQERNSRAALGLAGAEAQPFRGWLEDWSVTGAPTLPMTLHAATKEVALDLRLTSDKPLVLQGEQGLSQKGASPGNASYYYSYTRMPSTGTLRVGKETLAVMGASWMDREWSTSALERGQAGWDWFALQLGSGEELMFYQLRRRDGTTDTHSGGVWVDAAGATRPITRDEFHLEVEREWRSPDGARYPAAWRVRVPALQLDVRAQPYLADQEIKQRFRYWEGAVAVQGRRGDDEVSGSGYVELVGYGGGAAHR